MNFLIGFFFRKVLFWLLSKFGFSLLRLLIGSGFKKVDVLRGKVVREVVRIIVGLLVVGFIVGTAMLVVRIVIVVF
tara:strand:+ start:249 stop:476 length:228 start_codon:yes stop_codon:yes gene_type:complete